MNAPPAEGLASRLFLGPALRTQPDRRLVRLVRDGYETAFEEIVRRYGKPLGRYAAAISGGRSEEVTQDAFSKALLALRGMEGDRDIELRPWLYRIVRNTALNDLRDRPPEAAELAEVLEGGRSAAEEAERREELSELLERLRALPEPQRAAIVMRELEGLGHVEIAAALGLSDGGARQAIYRARQALRDGVGMLIPLPLVRTLIDHGAEAGAAVGAGGAVAAGGAIGGAGAGTAIKVGLVTAVLAGGVGTGLALKDPANHDPVPETAAAATARKVEGAIPGPSSEIAGSRETALRDGSSPGADGPGRGGRGSGGEGLSGEGSADAGGSGQGSSGPGADGAGGGQGGGGPGQGGLGGSSGPGPGGGEGASGGSGGGPGPSGGGALQGGGSDSGTQSGSGGPGSGELSAPTSPLSGGDGSGSSSGSSGSGSGSGDSGSTTTVTGSGSGDSGSGGGGGPGPG